MGLAGRFGRDFVRDLEGKLKIWRDLGRQPFEVFFGGKGVIGCIHTDGFENFRVFSQTVLLKPRFGEFAPPHVPSLIVKHPPPTRIFPRRGAPVPVIGSVSSVKKKSRKSCLSRRSLAKADGQAKSRLKRDRPVFFPRTPAKIPSKKQTFLNQKFAIDYQ
jgi:hypothetical protein